MKKLAFVLISVLLCVSANAQMRWNSKYQSYIDQYKDLAIEEMIRYRVPASITLAQGLLESGAGTSELTRRGNNHFGIKCHGWTGRTVYHDDDLSQECFRAYDNALQSFEDHCKFLRNGKRYSSLFNLSITDYKGWANGLKAAGYATNPRYATQLISIIELYKLHEYDKAKSYDKFMAKRSGTDQPVGGETQLHPIHIYNKNYYLYARQGDTFKLIGQEIGISYKKIARYNERDKKDALQPGEVIWLKKKQKRADKEYKNRPHTVKAGESMYSIAQYYGIRLKSLYKMNKISPDESIRVGQTLRVR
ncbi:MAG: glucosaminidase domain-containing protein [Prevotella sp.]|nr:glucosaminidase domain-containing protein [Prevotella sp.]